MKLEVWKSLNLNSNQRIIIYTDGSSKGNPGSGGWAAIIGQGQQSYEFYGNAQNVTNNQMELIAAIKGLSAIQKPSVIIIKSDSSYLCDAFLQNWIGKWQRNNWKTANKNPVKNKELWQELIRLYQFHKRVSWVQVIGHNGDRLNERADFLASEAALKLFEPSNEDLDTATAKFLHIPLENAKRLGEIENSNKNSSDVIAETFNELLQAYKQNKTSLQTVLNAIVDYEQEHRQ